MQPLYWSSTLAYEAESYAAECHGLVHSGVMGENLGTATYNDVERLYKLWEDERELFERSDSYRKKYPGSHSFGHYTQIVWAANTKVGCGQAYCRNLSQPYNLVCRYEIVGKGVDVEAKDDGNGGIIFVVLGGTVASGAFALLYVKKKKPEKYQKLCHQISMQQKEITKITKKLTLKVSNGTSTLGRKIIKRSKTTATFGRHFKKPVVGAFSHSKSSSDIYNDINIRLTDSNDILYKFNVDQYDNISSSFSSKKAMDYNQKIDYNKNIVNMNNYNFYERTSDKKKSIFSFASLKRKSYRKLSYSSVGHKDTLLYDEYPQNNKALPVPTYDLDIIEKMNNLDKYEQFITQSKSSSNADGSESRPLLKAYQSPLIRDRKGSDSIIDYRSSPRNSTYIMPSPQVGPVRMQRKCSLNGRKPRPGHEPTRIFEHQRSQSASNVYQNIRHNTNNTLQSDEYHNLVLDDLLQSYN
ncbi:hypothetical protein H8356DRAFT_1285297 [Neocallimastix lanati (nom. inval.)]|nr:hypothetical protein H8356DRAFT_1285297 [Neocallimastix sp. JGI-2020a]